MQIWLITLISTQKVLKTYNKQGSKSGGGLWKEINGIGSFLWEFSKLSNGNYCHGSLEVLHGHLFGRHMKKALKDTSYA